MYGDGESCLFDLFGAFLRVCIPIVYSYGVFKDRVKLHLFLNHSPAPSPLSQQFFFSLYLSPLPPPPLPPLKLVVLSSCRICLRVACGISLFFAKWWNVLLFYFSSLTLSAFGEGEIISNYRESRRCRPSSCACSYLLLCGRRMMRVVGNMHAHFACSSPCLLYLFSPSRACRSRPNETCRRELAIWRLSGLSSPIPAASEALAHAVGSLCLFTVIRYSFSGTPIRVSLFLETEKRIGDAKY